MGEGSLIVLMRRLVFRPLEALADCLLVALTYLLAVGVRVGGRIEATDPSAVLLLVAGAGVLQVVGNVFFRLYWRNWTLAALEDLVAIVKASLLPAAALLTVNAITDLHYIPTGSVVTGAGLVILVQSAIRLRPRWRRILRSIVGRRTGSQRLIVVGAGPTGQLLAGHLADEDSGHEIVCFVDDDPRKRGTYVRGIRVSGGVEHLPALIRRHRASLVVIAMRTHGGALARRVLALCEPLDVSVRAVRGFDMLNQQAPPLRSLEIEELIEREPVQFQSQEVRAYLAGRTVLVTGAAGSIGSEICRQALRYSPGRLLLLDTNESGLHDLQASLDQTIATELLLADVRDRKNLRRLFAAHLPSVVFHAAAYKHVPILEQSPLPGIAANVLGTANVLAASVAAQVDRFVFISTDKAVRPISVLGITKRVGELLTIAYARHYERSYAVVRFGNVLDSVGSVVPVFNRQLDRGGPITVTHAEATRYFMTIAEAAGLVLEAGGLAGQGDLLVLDMGVPLSIRDLAVKMIRLRGLRTPGDIEIHYVGLRPGEKLHEELFFPDETASGTEHPRILRATPTNDLPSIATVMAAVQQIQSLVEACDETAALAILRNLSEPAHSGEREGEARSSAAET
jgi:FlaA1/EpsC-like NDP-sugar epimerase